MFGYGFIPPSSTRANADSLTESQARTLFNKWKEKYPSLFDGFDGCKLEKWKESWTMRTQDGTKRVEFKKGRIRLVKYTII